MSVLAWWLVLGQLGVGCLAVLAGAAAAVRRLRRADELSRRAERRAAAAETRIDRLLALNRQLALENEALALESGRDRLTGLLNRVAFLDHLTLALARSRRTGGHVAMLFVDVDRLGDVNEGLGRATGDRLLALIGERALQAVREGDLIARYGDDAFGVLVPGVAFVQDALVVAERIRSSVSRQFSLEGVKIDITVSIGVAIDALHSEQPIELIGYAEAAMARAKQAGGDRVEPFDEQLRWQLRRLAGVAGLGDGSTSG